MPRPAILTLALGCALLCTGCPTVPLTDAVNNGLADDHGFAEAIRAAESAQRAYHFLADSPIDDIRKNPDEAADWITSARDAWRASQTYRINDGEPQIRTELPIREPEHMGTHTVDLFAKAVRARVAAYRNSFALTGIVSERGKPIFDVRAGNKLEPTPEFRPFLVGDKIDIDDILVRIRRR